ncbi:hypothetical protein ABG067_006600 [Albugo candida]
MVDGYSYSATLKIWLTNAIYTGVTLITGFLTLLFVYQDKLLYFPSIPGAPKLTKDNPSGPIMLSLTTLFFIKVCVGYRHPREYDIEHEDVMIPTEDGIRIHLRASFRAFDHLDELTSATSITFNPTADKIYAGFERMIRVFDLSRPSRDFESRPLAKTKKAKQGQRGLISSIHFNPDHSKMYAAGSFHGTTGLYAEDSGEELMTLCTHEGRGITQVRFSYDGNLLFTAARRDGRIHCWDIRQTNDILTTFHRKADTNQRIAFDLHCGGRYLISGSQDGRALLFDIQKGVQVSEKMRLSDAINGVSFFQDNCPLRIALCSGQRHYTVAPDMEEEEPMENDHQSTPQNVVQVYKYELKLSTL